MRKKSKKYVTEKNGCFFRIAWLVCLIIISVLISRFIMAGINDMLAIGKTSEIIQVEIPENADINQVSQELVNKNIIKEKWFFKLYAWGTRSSTKFYGGFYELETTMDYQTILNHIKNKENIRDVIEVTITEGMNVLECASLMNRNNICSEQDFLKACNSDKFKEKYKFVYENTDPKVLYKLEGYLFPDTYRFYKNEKPENVISKILNNYNKKIYNKLNNNNFTIEELARNKNMNLSDVITIASLIQAEAADKQDMYNISSVIHNRLETLKTDGHNRYNEFSLHILRIDATVYYPYKNKASVPANILKTFSSNYNTYQIHGLPPGPICNPGLDAIDAALNPARTDYYYYCHSSSGETFFARTNQVHVTNLKKAGLV